VRDSLEIPRFSIARASLRAMKRDLVLSHAPTHARSGLSSLTSLSSLALPGLVGLLAFALSGCGGPSSNTAADVDDDSNPKSASGGSGATDDGGATAAADPNAPAAPGSTDDATGPKKDECSVFDEPNIEGVLLKSACEAPSPTGQPPDLSKSLVVKVSVSPNVVAPGAHADVLVSFTNKSTAVLPLYFTIDPMPRFDIEVYNPKGNRMDLPKSSPPPLPAGIAAREPGEAKTARILLAPNGTARMPMGWDAVKLRWAPEKLKGTPPEKGYPRAPAGALPKGKYSLKVMTPLVNVFEGIEHEVSQPRADVVVKK
jgi:hypothetical protein